MFAVVCLLSLVGPEDVFQERCDCIEVNHFHDETGRHIFDQVIFWDFNPAGEWPPAYRVRDWRLLKCEHQKPLASKRGYTAVWHDGSKLRKVDATATKETWTQFDPEIEDRKFIPQEERL